MIPPTVLFHVLAGLFLAAACSQAAGLPRPDLEGQAPLAPLAAGQTTARLLLDAPAIGLALGNADLADLERWLQSGSGNIENNGRQRLLSLLQELQGRHDDAYLSFKALKGVRDELWRAPLNLYLADKLGLEEEALECLAILNARHERRKLEIGDMRLCSAVAAFGRYEPLPKAELLSGQRIIVYVELQHLEQAKSGEHYRATFKGTLEVFDPQSRRVHGEAADVFNSESRSRLRDVFVRVIWKVPALKPGPYDLAYAIEEGQQRVTRSMAISIR